MSLPNKSTAFTNEKMNKGNNIPILNNKSFKIHRYYHLYKLYVLQVVLFGENQRYFVMIQKG